MCVCVYVCVRVCVCVRRSLTESSQELVAAWEPPQLHTDGHLDGQQGEVLLLLPSLELNQHLVELG